MGSHHVVSGSELQRLRFRAKLWSLGWLLSAASVAFGAYCLGSKLVYDQAIVAVRDLQSEQDSINKAQAKTLSEQNKLAETTALWATVNQEPLRGIIDAEKQKAQAARK